MGSSGSLAACTVLVVASSACGDGRDFIAAMLLPLGAGALLSASAQGTDNELALSAQQQKLLAALEAADLAKQEIAPAPAPADGRRQPKAGDAAPSEGGSAEAPAPTADEVDESAVRV
ncbi:hypothetical protein EMIHUDRAFT_460554 [Emiliania huxleyi CCMP1516]|uniref:Uncharacterized protein n=2 Tax=Emiliania huxleyi TaxID=2903 RepID=A0A0D3KKD0_EMIH1|nr:hypothetical protein EMIHUDRAFT_460554 [Emiliania huxleyi CCMP1516]EOD36215.1 hypothetical protein EMIHUDRAFT_460554 [Emiliania huxleyi CCMP1516]|eukprot:XP_005788644.1 hypothetical protein EMIHUDRAFT_460554 [Emiliania huxleyi CCMP1516]